MLFDNEQGVSVLREKIYVTSVFDRSVAVFRNKSIHVPVKKSTSPYVDSIVISISCEFCRNCGSSDIELKRFDLVDEDLDVLEVRGICDTCAYPKVNCPCCDQFPCEEYIVPRSTFPDPDLCTCCFSLPCINYRGNNSAPN